MYNCPKPVNLKQGLVGHCSTSETVKGESIFTPDYLVACKDIDDPHAYKPDLSEPEPEINLMVKHNICSEIKYNLLG